MALIRMRPYTCIYVGGWEVFGSPPFVFTLRQARCSFNTKSSAETFIPQVTACINYVIDVPVAPLPGPDFGPAEVWDEGLWGSSGARILLIRRRCRHQSLELRAGTSPEPIVAPTRSTMWVSIGETGWSHAPIVQASVFQEAKPDVEMLGISMLAEKAGVAV